MSHFIKHLLFKGDDSIIPFSTAGVERLFNHSQPKLYAWINLHNNHLYVGSTEQPSLFIRLGLEYGQVVARKRYPQRRYGCDRFYGTMHRARMEGFIPV